MNPSHNATVLFMVAIYHWFVGDESVAYDAIEVALCWTRQPSDLGDS